MHGLSQSDNKEKEKVSVKIEWLEITEVKPKEAACGSATKSAEMKAKLEKQELEEKDAFGHGSNNYKRRTFKYIDEDEAVQAGSVIGGIVGTIGGLSLAVAASEATAELILLGLLAGPAGLLVGGSIGLLGAVGITKLDHSLTDDSKEKYKKWQAEYKKLKNTSKFKQVEKLQKQMESDLQDMKNSEENVKFSMDKYNMDHKKIMIIGPTKWGKSTLSNALMGKQILDVFVQSIKGAVSSSKDNIDFDVSRRGNPESCTKEISPKTKGVIMTYHSKNTNDVNFQLSVIDTPGSNDINGKTDSYMNSMLSFCRQYGGVNLFVIVFKYDAAFDASYEALMKQCEKVWGQEIWKHCIIVVTNCDKDNIVRRMDIDQNISKTKETIQKFLNLCCSNKELIKNIPILQTGLCNQDETIEKLFEMITNEESPFYNEYKCDQIRFPIDDVFDKYLAAIKELKNTKEFKRARKLFNKLNAKKN